MAYCLEGNFVQYSSNFGTISIYSKYFDDSKDLGGTEDSLLHNIIKSIKIYTGKVNNREIIGGIQITYKNIKTKEIKELPIRKGDIKYEDEEVTVFELKSPEYLTKFYIRFDSDENGDYIYQLGFETNKNRKIIKGSEYGKYNNTSSLLENIIILGTFGHYREKMDSFGVLYVKLKDFFDKLNRGYFELKLRHKKDIDFKKKIEQKYESLSISDKFLFKSCLLPDSPFNEIMKFCML